MKYNYHVSVFAQFEVDVEAETPEEAYRKAREEYINSDKLEFVDEISDNLYDEDFEEVDINNFKI